MKTRIAAAVIAVAGVAAMAQTCIVTNESLTPFDDRDTFAGELRNESGIDILQHRYRVAFLNVNGAVVQSFTVEGCLRSVQDGESNFFAARSTLDDSVTTIGLARIANLAEDPNFTVGQVEDGDIVFSDVSAERDAGTLTVTGTITNEDDDELEVPQVCAIVWNDDDRVVTIGKDIGIDDLDEGQSADFSIEIDVPDDDDLVDRVDVWADGLEDDVPVAPASEEDVDLTVVPATATPTPVPPTPTPVP